MEIKISKFYCILKIKQLKFFLEMKLYQLENQNNFTRLNKMDHNHIEMPFCSWLVQVNRILHAVAT